MDNNVKDLENLLYDDKSGFEIVLRMGQGIDEKKFIEICNILLVLKDNWSECSHVPKEFMQIFLEFRESCENSLTLYDEDEQIRILQHIDKILDLVNEIICE
ncbi:MAG: hypothetical protein K2G51_14115 [Lachnospiraceae bacterium]|nr:hypothetical protein [Lachnospiraceae bacterium]MDE7271529.1 hypothetical protein [Lachnospiraceae bacterium]